MTIYAYMRLRVSNQSSQALDTLHNGPALLFNSLDPCCDAMETKETSRLNRSSRPLSVELC